MHPAKCSRVRVEGPFWHSQSALGAWQHLFSHWASVSPPSFPCIDWKIRLPVTFQWYKPCVSILKGPFQWAAILGPLWLGLCCAPNSLLGALLRVVQLGALHQSCHCRFSENSWVPQGLHIPTTLWHQWGRVTGKAFYSPGYWLLLLPKIFIARANPKF